MHSPCFYESLTYPLKKERMHCEQDVCEGSFNGKALSPLPSK